MVVALPRNVRNFCDLPAGASIECYPRFRSGIVDWQAAGEYTPRLFAHELKCPMILAAFVIKIPRHSFLRIVFSANSYTPEAAPRLHVLEHVSTITINLTTFASLCR
jgi:hypothetical protein